ncbi:MAG: Crp/Fnr family transcriptional regulator [Selenomonadaceae bacterium]|nr:Crp/Fnr family transcriptional regulator [Selenomonadaceae bacterium]
MQIFNLDLQELPLFRGLSMGEIENFINHTASVTKRYEKGSYILRPYERNSNIGVIVTGLAQVISEDRLGNETVGHALERGSLLGSTSAILSEEYNPTAIEPLTDVLVLWIPYRSLLVAGPKLGRVHGIVMKNLLEAFCNKNVLMLEKLKLLSQKSLRERVILYLLQKEKRQKSPKIKVPRRIQLAKELECNRSALTREIGLMVKDGILVCERDSMCLQKDKL